MNERENRSRFIISFKFRINVLFIKDKNILEAIALQNGYFNESLNSLG